MDEMGERSGNATGIHMQVYKLDMKNIGDTYQNNYRELLKNFLKRRHKIKEEEKQKHGLAQMEHKLKEER